MRNLLIVAIAFCMPLFCAKPMTNSACKECHPDIFEEYRHSWHAKSWHNDLLHRKVAQRVPRYECGRCHMPMAENLVRMNEGLEWPDDRHKGQKEAVACFYCHQIAYVKKAHRYNEIQLARQAQGLKPTLFGTLEDPDSSDKHEMVHSPIYEKYACTGCHGHKRNGYGVLIYQATGRVDGSEACIKCHMPKEPGGVEKMNKKARRWHHSHRFAGIHDWAMRQKSVEIRFKKASNGWIDVVVHNKMGHPLIIHPARMKYLKLSLWRKGRKIWENFKTSPREDAQCCFTIDFLGEHDEPIDIPYFARKRGFVNNIDANGTKILRYKLPPMEKNDRMVAEMFVILAKPSCADAAGIEAKNLRVPILMKRIEWRRR